MIIWSLSPVVRQCLIVIAANLSGIGAGLCLAWPSPVLIKLEDSNSTVLSRRLTVEESTWLASLSQLVCVVVLIVGFPIIDRIGRKKAFSLIHLPKLIASLLFVFGTQVWELMVARVCDGVSLAFYSMLLSTYTSEIADKNVRGCLGTIIQIFRSTGLFFMLSIAPFLSYSALQISYVVITIISALPIMFLPETPYFLYSKGKTEESEKVLNSIRTTKQEVNAELQMFATNKTKEDINIFKLLQKKEFLKAMGITLILGAIGPCTGFGLVGFYLQSLMESSGTNVKSEVASLIVGIVQLLACFPPLYTTDRFGRKPLLFANTLLVAVGSFGMGTFFWCKEAGYEINPFLNILPTICASIMNFAAAGYLSVLFILLPELFLGEQRALGVSSGSIAYSLGLFTVTKSYSALLTSPLGFHGSFWLCGVVSFATMTFVIFCVPETKGKMFDEIQVALRGKVVKNVDESIVSK